MKKIAALGVVILSIIILVLMTTYFESADPIQGVLDYRLGALQNIEVINTIKKDNGTIIYSVGKVNNGDHYMYSVDMVDKSLAKYKWVGGGGHMNQDMHNHDFALSAQLLNEEQIAHPTLFGVLKDRNIKEIKANARNSETLLADFYEIQDGEWFYAILINVDVASSPYFYLTITYGDGSTAQHFFIEQDLVSLQKGNVFYLSNYQFIKQS